MQYKSPNFKLKTKNPVTGFTKDFRPSHHESNDMILVRLLVLPVYHSLLLTAVHLYITATKTFELTPYSCKLQKFRHRAIGSAVNLDTRCDQCISQNCFWQNPHYRGIHDYLSYFDKKNFSHTYADLHCIRLCKAD